MMNKEAVNDEKLTLLQERFCAEYVIDYNGSAAAIRAGYSEKTARAKASQLLKDSRILAKISKFQEEQTRRLCLSADWVVKELVETYKKCSEPVEVLVWDDVQRKKVPSGTYAFDSKGALQALELLGKHLVMFTDKNVVDVGSKVVILDDLEE